MGSKDQDKDKDQSTQLIKICFLDGCVREFNSPVTGYDIAFSISERFLKDAVAIKVNEKLQDLCDPITENAQVHIITIKDPVGLEIMRHTIAAQLLARAIKNLFPQAKLAIGPVIKDGFYYDFKADQIISSQHLDLLEQEMLKIAKEGHKIIKKIVPKAQAIKMFADLGEEYKVNIIKESTDAEFPIYYQGDTGFIDLCRGPHLPCLQQVKTFKLTKLAGAYWKGDSNNEMLTRVYGTAWLSSQELKIYLDRLAEAEKRDHRKICQAMDLLHFQGDAPGQVFWHDKGWIMFKLLENYIREKLQIRNYQEVNTPKIISKDLFVQSGHWEKFGTDSMFVCDAYNGLFALKPMNCPCHVQIFKQGIKSYKELPIKMAEFGNCFRQEARGALHGLMRVTAMTQDDAHIFCTIDQIKSQVLELYDMIAEIYRELGFNDFFVRFADRPEHRVGEDFLWDHAETALIEAAEQAGIKWSLNKGDGAFYGPKLEFVLLDAIGREWQCGTIQLDFNLPRRLGANYIDVNGEKQFPVMIHRALLGSMERFLGMFIEHYAGNFPLWIAPTQLAIFGITDKHIPYVHQVGSIFKQAGIRVLYDDSNEKINYKIREHFNSKVVYIGIVGDQEVTNGTITIRRLGSNQQNTYGISEFVEILQEEINNKKLPPQYN